MKILYSILLFFFIGCSFNNNVKQESVLSEEKPCWIQNPYCYKSGDYKFLAVGRASLKKGNDTHRLARKKAEEELAKQIDSRVTIEDTININSKQVQSNFFYVETESVKTTLLTNVKLNIKQLESYKDRDNYYVLYSIDEKKVRMQTTLNELKTILFYLAYSPVCYEDNFCKNELDRAKRYILEVDFNFLKLHHAIDEIENKAIYEGKIKEIEYNINEMRNVSKSSIKEKKFYLNTIEKKLNKELDSLCKSIKNSLGFELLIENHQCEIFLDNKSVCKEFCGELPSISISNAITLDDLHKLTNISELHSIVQPLYYLKKDYEFLHNLINKDYK